MNTIGLIVSSIIGVLFSGFVGAQLWNWFIAATFNVQRLDIGAAVGMSLLVSYYVPSQAKVDEKEWTYLLLFAFSRSLIALIFGFIVAVLIGRIGN